MRLVTANSALEASLAIYHVISNVRSWNNCNLSHERNQAKHHERQSYLCSSNFRHLSWGMSGLGIDEANTDTEEMDRTGRYVALDK